MHHRSNELARDLSALDSILEQVALERRWIDRSALSRAAALASRWKEEGRVTGMAEAIADVARLTETSLRELRRSAFERWLGAPCPARIAT